MNLTLDDNRAAYQIRAYTPGTLIINEETFTQTVLLSANTLITDHLPASILELTAAQLAPIGQYQPAILLIGTGETLIFPPVEVYGDLINQGVGVEIMRTQSACYTYNALTAEERRVMALLIIK